MAAHTSPLDVDLDELIATLGAEAASWLVDALKQTPGAALLDLALRGPALRALVGAQLAVRILEPSDGPFPEHAVVSRGDHIRAVRRALADGERPPMGSMRMIPLVRALHTQVPFVQLPVSARSVSRVIRGSCFARSCDPTGTCRSRRRRFKSGSMT